MENQLIPNELNILTYLKPRMKLSSEDKFRLQQLQHGHAGETNFFKILKQKLSNHCLPLFNLLLETDGSLFQVDCLILCHNSIYMYEVKNYTGDYYIQNNRWYIVNTKKEIRNPLLQLERSHYLLKELIGKYPTSFAVKSYIAFVNQTFTLYQAPLNQSIIFPGQIERHINRINEQVKFNHNIKQQKELAKWLLEQQVERNFANLPEYSFDSLGKGMFCKRCWRRIRRYNRIYLICPKCQQKENIEKAVLRHIEQFTILFPKKRITTNTIYKWCGKLLTKKVILRILKKYYKLIYCGKNSYFI